MSFFNLRNPIEKKGWRLEHFYLKAREFRSMYHIEKGCPKKLIEYMYSVLNLNEILFFIGGLL